MNYVALIGRLTKDPELRVLESGKKVVRFSVAVDRYGGQADFIPCIAWDKTAETICKYLSKGRKIAIQGNINVRSYEQNNETRWSTNVIVDRFEFIDSYSQQNSNSNDDYTSSKEASKPFLNDDVTFDEADNDEEDFPF